MLCINMTVPVVNEDGLVAEAQSLPELLHHLRKQNGDKLWIHDTGVYIKSHLDSREITSACVLSMLVISEKHHIEDCIAIIGPNRDQQRDVAVVTARIVSLYDPVHEKLVFFSSNPHSSSITTYFTPKEIQQMIRNNASREHCFHRCLFTSEQSAALLDHESPVHLCLDQCSLDTSAMADVLARKKSTINSLGTLTLINGSTNVHEERSMESFWIALNKPSDDPLFDELTLNGYSFGPTDAFHLAGANVRCLGLAGDCQFDEGACDLIAKAFEKSSFRAKSLQVDYHYEDQNHWSHRLIQAVGNECCTLEELSIMSHYDSDDYMIVSAEIMDMLKGNEHLRRLYLSTTPLEFSKRSWNEFLETLSCHKSLRQVTLRPPSESVPSGWKDDLETLLFRRNQDIAIFVKAQQSSDRVDLAREWQEQSDCARLRGTCRILDHRARSFVLNSVLKQNNDKHGLIYSLLSKNLDLLVCLFKESK